MDERAPQEELRLWGRPGRRADLAAQCWQAGVDNVSDLARLAGLGSRTTIYSDLRSRGIDPNNRPKTRTIMPLTMTTDGHTYTGEESEEVIQRNAQQVYKAAAAAGRPDYACQSAAQRHADKWRFLRWYHQDLVPAKEDERRAHQALEVARAVHDHAYAALGEVPNERWLAAHHQFQRADAELRAALETWTKAVSRLDTAMRTAVGSTEGLDENARALYRQTAEPESDRSATARQVRDDLATRSQVVAKTAGLIKENA